MLTYHNGIILETSKKKIPRNSPPSKDLEIKQRTLNNTETKSKEKFQYIYI